MRWFVTLLLLALVLIGGVWLVARDRVQTAIGIAPVAPTNATAESFSVLEDTLRPEKVRELRILAPGHAPLSLTRNPDGSWSQPGNWPLRDGEVATLVTALTTLRSRFAPVPIASDLSAYGLDKPGSRVDVAVTIATDSGTKTTTLAFGHPSAGTGEPEFARPCYLRIEDRPEVIRLGPDVFPVLSRSPEVYRRRQLIPDVERVKLSGGERLDPNSPTPPTGRVPLLGDRYASVRVEREGTTYTLTRTGPTPGPRRDPDRPAAEPAIAANRLAAAWVLEFAGVRDRVDPAKLRTVLTRVPDLWVEGFPAKTSDTGLDKPDRSLTVTRTDGKPITVLLGNVSRTQAKSEPAPPPMFGAPPMPPKMTVEEYRYARLKDNDLVFELRTDTLADLFADPQEFRDPALARFETGEVTELTVAVKGKPPVKITKRPGKKDAEKDEDRQDRWYVGEVLAESSKVTDLLDQLSRLEARGKDSLVDSADAARLKEFEIDPKSGTTMTVTAATKPAEGDAPLPPRTFTFHVGKDDTDKKKLAVQVAGWDRINLVDDTIVKLIDRPALAYRGRRLFDTARLTLESVAVKKDAADAFTLTHEAGLTPRWKLAKPLQADADATKASQLTGDLSRLEVVEFVDDAPKPEDLEKFGLTKPRFTVALGFTGPGAKPQTLEIGAAREGKPEAFARLNGGGSVFAVPKTIVDALDQGAIAFLPAELWSVPTDKLTSIEIRRGEAETYKLTADGSNWKISGPFDATASFTEVQPLLAAAASVRAEKYEALTADPAKHGLDKPALRVAVTYKESKPGDKPEDVPVTKTLLLGHPTAPGASTRFAKLESGANPAVFIVPESLIKEADRPALARLDRSLLAVDPGQVAKVQITGPTADAAVTLTRDDQGTWKVEGAAFKVDEPTITRLVQIASRPPVDRLAAYGPAVKWAELGLDKPQYAVTLTVGKDKPATQTIKIGKTETSGERYLRVDDGPAAGVLTAKVAESLTRGKLDFADRSLLSFDSQALTAITRKKGKDELEVIQSGINWELKKPVQQKADLQTLQNLADLLAKLRVARVAAHDPKDLDKPFGLKDPATVFTLKLGDKETKTLRIGNPVDPKKPDGDRYATAGDGTGPVTVGVLSEGVARLLLDEPLKFRDRALARFVDADRITLQRGERKVTFAKIGGTWKVTEPVAADAEQSELDELVNALATLRADDLVAEKPADLKPYGLASPEARWQLFAGDKEVLNLVIGSKGKENRVHAMLEKGEVVALLDPDDSRRVLGEYRKRAVFADADASQAETLVLSAGTATVVLQKSGSDWKDPAKPDDPIDAAKVTEVLSAFAGLKAERYVADKDAKLALYGLEKPARVIVVTQKGGAAKTLHLGGPVGGTSGKQVYAKLPDSATVFVLSAADTALLTRDRAAFVGKKSDGPQ